MVTVVKTKIKVSNKLEQLQKYIKIVAVSKDILLSNTEVILISHFMLEGYNDVSKQSILEQKVITSYNNLHNILNKLRGKAIVTGKQNGNSKKKQKEKSRARRSFERVGSLLLWFALGPRLQRLRRKP